MLKKGEKKIGKIWQESNPEPIDPQPDTLPLSYHRQQVINVKLLYMNLRHFRTDF